MGRFTDGLERERRLILLLAYILISYDSTTEDFNLVSDKDR